MNSQLGDQLNDVVDVITRKLNELTVRLVDAAPKDR